MLFSPGTVVANDLAPQEPAKPAPATPTPTPPDTTSVSPGSVSAAPLDAKALLAAINADREDREKRAKSDQETTTYKKRAEEAELKLADIEKAKRNRLLDPAGFLKKFGYTDRDLALTAEGIMFSLMPDKAPPSHVANLVKAQREQDLADQEDREKAREAETQRQRAESASVQEREIEARYRLSLKNEVAALKPGTFPASEAWYADDHDGFAQELFDTARNLAEEAVKAGKTIDVSASAIAQHIEKKYAERAKRLAALIPQSQMTTQPPKTQAKPVEPSLPEEKKEPVQPNHRLTEKEIIERATKAAFGL